MGVDVIEFTPNWHIVSTQCRSFKRKTDFAGIVTQAFIHIPYIALLYKVPLVFWGEAQADITAYYDH